MAESDPNEANAHADLCRLLAACYYEPGSDFAEERLFESMLAAARQLDPELAALAEQLGQDFLAQDLAFLVADYTRLFRGPGQPRVVPSASFWLGAKASEAALLGVEDLYRQAGFEPAEEFAQTPDHVAVELEFLSLLLCKRGQARRTGLTEVLSAWNQLSTAFLQDHLATWIGGFAPALEAAADTAFYRRLARLTERFVRTEAQRGQG